MSAAFERSIPLCNFLHHHTRISKRQAHVLRTVSACCRCYQALPGAYQWEHQVRASPVGQADVEAAAGVVLGGVHHPLRRRPHTVWQQRQVPQHPDANAMALYQAILLHRNAV